MNEHLNLLKEKVLSVTYETNPENDISWKTIQIQTTQQDPKAKNCGYHALYNLSLCSRLTQIKKKLRNYKLSIDSNDNSQHLLECEKEHQGILELLLEKDSERKREDFVDFCKKIRENLGLKSNREEINEWILERGQLLKLTGTFLEKQNNATQGSQMFDDILPFTELITNEDFPKLIDFFNKNLFQEPITTHGFVVAVVDHYIGLYINKMEDQVEVLVFDSLNDSVLSPMSDTQLELYSLEKGFRYERNKELENNSLPVEKQKKPRTKEEREKNNQIRILRLKKTRTMVDRVKRYAMTKEATAMFTDNLDDHIDSLISSFDSIARCKEEGKISLKLFIYWIENYYPVAMFRSRDIVMMEHFPQHYISLSTCTKVVDWKNLVIKFVDGLTATEKEIINAFHFLDVLNIFMIKFENRLLEKKEDENTDTEQCYFSYVDRKNCQKYLQRQNTIPDWNEDLICSQTALVLGIGGIGCSVAMALCRLGIKKMVIVDNDVVEASNLNRQILFMPSDIGNSKVHSAAKRLRDSHAYGTMVIPYHIDVLDHWQLLVELAEQSTAIFNCVDVGEAFDLSVTSLCVRLNIPYISSSSFMNTWCSEVFCNPTDDACFGCNSMNKRQKEVTDMLHPDRILSHATLNFLPVEGHEFKTTSEIGSNIFAACGGGVACVSMWANTIMRDYLNKNNQNNNSDEKPVHWAKTDTALSETFSFTIEANPRCTICETVKQGKKKFFDHYDLYFGCEKVQLSPVNGSFSCFYSGCIEQSASDAIKEKCKMKAMQRKGPLHKICVDKMVTKIPFPDVYVPAIPANDFIRIPPSQAPGEKKGKSEIPAASAIPSFLLQPHVKSPSGRLEGIRSGNRSALIFDRESKTAYRLKGCGNYVDDDGLRFSFPGFPLEELPFVNGVEVRGCSWQYAVMREQHYSDHFSHWLGKYGWKCGNESLGWWDYNLSSKEDPSTSHIPKACGLYKTNGERRLNADLLKGLYKILDLVCEGNIESDMIKNIEKQFQNKDRITSKNGRENRIVPSWEETIKKRSLFPAVDHLVDLRDVDMSHNDLDFSVLKTLPAEKNPLWRDLWEKAISNLKIDSSGNNDGKNELFEVLKTLFLHLGSEVGMFCNLLQEQDIIWGYFIDHNPFLPHCNAHPNNFAILEPLNETLHEENAKDAFSEDAFLPKANGTTPVVDSPRESKTTDEKAFQILTPVDFDFMFSKDSFFSPYTDKFDEDLFQSWHQTEIVEMERALGGDEANTGISLDAGGNETNEETNYTQENLFDKVSQRYEVLKWALTDTMMIAFRKELVYSHQMKNENVPSKSTITPLKLLMYDKAKIIELQSIITLALILSS